MVAVTTVEGRFNAEQKSTLISELTKALLRNEGAPDHPAFRENVAGFIHELPWESVATASGEHDVVRVDVLTPEGALDRDQQIGVVRDLTAIVSAVAGDESLAQRTWVLLTESPDGGWGISGRALSRADIRLASSRISPDTPY